MAGVRSKGGMRLRSQVWKKVEAASPYEMEQMPLFGPLPKRPRRRRRGVKLGRPRKAGSGSPHRKRPEFKSTQPLHAVLRAHKVLKTMRRRDVYKAIRWASIVAAKWEEFRIVHISIQRTHVHLLIEAKDKVALARGLKSFQISAAKLINRVLPLVDGKRRRGSVFPDRYHLEVITNCLQARHALAYVLNNWRKHREDQAGVARTWLVDPFSSGCYFEGWRELEGRDLFWELPDTYENLAVWFPKTWLLRVGWKQYGLIGCREVPGSKDASAKKSMSRA